MPESVKLINDPILRKPCEAVNLLDMVFVDGLLSAMNETMVAENGMGLAANQIGHSVRVFILKEENSFSEYINPEIVEQSELTQFEGEGCLSIPGVNSTTKRYNKLRLTWLDKNGTKKEGEFLGIRAFAVQHEMDHLNGKLYVDQFGPLKRQMVLDKHRKYLRLGGKR